MKDNILRQINKNANRNIDPLRSYGIMSICFTYLYYNAEAIIH